MSQFVEQQELTIDSVFCDYDPLTQSQVHKRRHFYSENLRLFDVEDIGQ